MIKQTVVAVIIGASSLAGVIQASASTIDIYSATSQSIIYGKKITKAQCLKKDGYVWISSEKKCVKPSRGSN